MKVGFIGLGIMGMPMATNISKKFELIGYDVQPKETPFPFAASIKEVVEFADVVVSMVPKNEHVLKVYEEIYPNVREGQVFIDMSTISPKVSACVAERIESLGAEMLDCPVVKSQPAAVSGTLGIYVGGKQNVFERVRPVLECMGKNIIHMGDHGQGLVMKILHNSLVGMIQNGVNEVMGVAKTLGINLENFVEAISYGGGQNFYMDGKAKNIIANSYPTAFSVENMHKDAHLAIALLDDYELDMPGMRNTVKVYDKAMEMGLGREDFSATFKVVNKE